MFEIVRLSPAFLFSQPFGLTASPREKLLPHPKYLPPGGRCREATDEECGQKSHSPYKSVPPPHPRPVILSEQSESKDLRTNSTQNVTFVRRSLHSLRSVEMTELLVRWRPLRFLYRQVISRIPHPALRGTFPPGEGFVETASFCWGCGGMR